MRALAVDRLLHEGGEARTVDAGGQMDLSHTNGDGSGSILAAQLSNDVLTGHVDREACHYSVSLAKK